MDIFTIDVTQNELTFIRQALDIVTVSGKDAKFLANLQHKVEQELIEIQRMLSEQEQIKQEQLQSIINEDVIKMSKKKS
jgi:Tfp pilus assembly protein PilN